MIGLFVLVEWNNRNKVEPISGKRNFLKLALAITAILAFGTFSDYKEFIYFQF
jgi:alginate O-acetyltransferase complex protein AlgI